MHAKVLQSCLTLWTVGHQALLSIGVCRQEYWSGLPCPPPGIFPTQGSNPHLLQLPNCMWILYCWAIMEAPYNVCVCVCVCVCAYMSASTRECMHTVIYYPRLSNLAPLPGGFLRAIICTSTSCKLVPHLQGLRHSNALQKGVGIVNTDTDGQSPLSQQLSS